MTDWQALAEKLAAPLRGLCRCEYARDKAGVPIWRGVPLERVKERTCSACKALAAYDLAISQEDTLILKEGV